MGARDCANVAVLEKDGRVAFEAFAGRCSPVGQEGGVSGMAELGGCRANSHGDDGACLERGAAIPRRMSVKGSHTLRLLAAQLTPG